MASCQRHEFIAKNIFNRQNMNFNSRISRGRGLDDIDPGQPKAFYKRWSEQDIRVLLKHWKKNIKGLQMKHNAGAYKKITKGLIDDGILVSDKEVFSKIGHLRRNYLSLEKSKKPVNWMYFNDIKNIYEENKVESDDDDDKSGEATIEKPYKKRWTEHDTRILIKHWRQNLKGLTVKNNAGTYLNITKGMVDEGIVVTIQEVWDKISSIKRKTRILEKRSNPKEWIFFDDVKKIMENNLEDSDVEEKMIDKKGAMDLGSLEMEVSDDEDPLPTEDLTNCVTVAPNSCRICLVECSDNAIDIETVQDLLVNCFGNCLQPDDTPKKCCDTCLEVLYRFDTFKKRFEETEGVLAGMRQLPISSEANDKVSPKSDEPISEANFFNFDILLAISDQTTSVFESFVLSYNLQAPWKKKIEKLSPNLDTELYEQSSYPCDHCFYVARSQKSLTSHIEKCPNAKGIKPTTCLLCSSKFKSQLLYELHQEAVHSGTKRSSKNTIHCTFCIEKFDYHQGIMELNRHIYNIRDGNHQKFLKCLCRKEFPALDLLRKHCRDQKCTENLVLLRPLQCDICQFSCCYEGNMVRHCNKIHAKRLLKVCFCGEIVYCDDLKVQHIVFQCKLTPERVKVPFREIIGSEFTQEDAAEKFKSIAKETCIYCGIQIASRYLQEHITLKHTAIQRGFDCHLCNTKFTRKSILKVHIKKLHPKQKKPNTTSPNNETTQYGEIRKSYHRVCDLCGKQVKAASLQDHINVHHLGMRFECDLCGIKIKDKNNLRKHMQSMHLKTLLYNCNFCGQSFHHWGNRRDHEVAYHTKDYKFSCEICGMKFTRQSRLNNHKVSHTDFRAFECDQCKMMFKTKFILQEHIRGVHSKEFFECTECGMMLKSKKYLRQHKNKQHKVVKK